MKPVAVLVFGHTELKILSGDEMKTPQTPHAYPVEGGGTVYLSHADWIEYLYSAAERWSKAGERQQAALIKRKILAAKRGAKRCAVCLRAQGVTI